MLHLLSWPHLCWQSVRFLSSLVALDNGIAARWLSDLQKHGRYLFYRLDDVACQLAEDAGSRMQVWLMQFREGAVATAIEVQGQFVVSLLECVRCSGWRVSSVLT